MVNSEFIYLFAAFCDILVMTDILSRGDRFDFAVIALLAGDHNPNGVRLCFSDLFLFPQGSNRGPLYPNTWRAVQTVGQCDYCLYQSHGYNTLRMGENPIL